MVNRALNIVTIPTVQDHLSDTALGPVQPYGILPVVAAAAPLLGKLMGKKKKPKAPKAPKGAGAGAGVGFTPAVVGMSVGILGLAAVLLFTLGTKHGRK